jgi:hypothetical protein
MSKKLIKLLENETNNLIREFEQASLIGHGTPQEISDFRENAFRSFLERYFPWPYKISKGKIYDINDNFSNSIDCVLINPNHPNTIDSKGKFSLILADGVDCVIEIKPDLANKDELIRALKQIVTVKKISRSKPIFMPLSIKKDHIVEYSKKIPSFIFCLKSYKEITKVVDEIVGFYNKNNTPVSEQFDFIVINNFGILSNIKHPELSPARNEKNEKVVGYIFEEWMEMTLAAFLVKVNSTYPAEMQVSEPIVSRFLKNIRPKKIYSIS